MHLRNIRILWAGLAALSGVLCTAPAFGQTSATLSKVTLDQAIQLALRNNHSLLAARTTIPQNLAQEVTANLRPNPTLFTDWEYLPLPGVNVSGGLGDLPQQLDRNRFRDKLHCSSADRNAKTGSRRQRTRRQ